MISRKRKAGGDEESCSLKQQKDSVNEIANVIALNCVKIDCDKSLNKQETDNGSLELSSSSDNTKTEADAKDSGNEAAKVVILDSVKIECDNSMDEEESNNGSSEKPSTSNNTKNKDDFKDCEKEIANVDASDCVITERDKSLDIRKSSNGSSQQPSTSDNIKTKDDSEGNKNETSNVDALDCVNTDDQSKKKLAKVKGSNIAGTLLFCGFTNWDLIGRRELPKNAKNATGVNLWGPHRLTSLEGIRVAAVFAGCVAAHSVIVTETGQAYTWGRNEVGQLGLGDTKRRDSPTLVETLKDHTIIHASCGRGHTLFLSDRGVVYASGNNKLGQCGVGSQNNNLTIPTKITFKEKSITRVACGAEFSVIVDKQGSIYSFGCPEYGQLGHNSDGKYFVAGRKIAFNCELVPKRIAMFIEKTRERHIILIEDVQILNVACGINHCVAVDSKGRCYSWGFGGYGRLGHSSPSDEMVPRLIKTFDGPGKGVKNVFAGGTYSMTVNFRDVLYFWGQNNRTSEATMYPKPVQDLAGWQVRDVGCSNTSIVCVADESVISWGAGPTFGELGYGENKQKSSTRPQEVRSLDGIHIHSVAMGLGHTLLIARDETEEDKRKLEKLPEYAP